MTITGFARRLHPVGLCRHAVFLKAIGGCFRLNRWRLKIFRFQVAYAASSQL
jgi:hypothetical protein